MFTRMFEHSILVHLLCWFMQNICTTKVHWIGGSNVGWINQQCRLEFILNQIVFLELVTSCLCDRNMRWDLFYRIEITKSEFKSVVMVHLRSARLIYETQTFIQANGIAHCDITNQPITNKDNKQIIYTSFLATLPLEWSQLNQLNFTCWYHSHLNYPPFPEWLINISPQGKILTCL